MEIKGTLVTIELLRHLTSANLSEQRKRLLVIRSQVETLKTNLVKYKFYTLRLEFADAELQGIESGGGGCSSCLERSQ
jgi:hypothetical protein